MYRRMSMEIAIIADDNKKELMAQFCIAYCGVLQQHHLCATYSTGKYISDQTGLEIETMLMGSSGGMEQIASKISFDEIDCVFYFRSTEPAKEIHDYENTLLRLCDVYNIPLATNIATAEALVTALENGNLSWREYINPRSEYNVNKRRRYTETD
jgi:methylglyoxal synthase